MKTILIEHILIYIYSFIQAFSMYFSLSFLLSLHSLLLQDRQEDKHKVRGYNDVIDKSGNIFFVFYCCFLFFFSSSFFFCFGKSDYTDILRNSESELFCVRTDAFWKEKNSIAGFPYILFCSCWEDCLKR